MRAYCMRCKRLNVEMADQWLCLDCADPYVQDFSVLADSAVKTGYQREHQDETGYQHLTYPGTLTSYSKDKE